MYFSNSNFFLPWTRGKQFMATATKPLNRQRNPPLPLWKLLFQSVTHCAAQIELAEVLPSVNKWFLKIKMETFFKRVEFSNMTQSVTAFSNCLLFSVFKYLHIYPEIFSFLCGFFAWEKSIIFWKVGTVL